MRLRAYIENIDFPYLQKWTCDERVHYLWCAGLFPYPLQRESFQKALNKNASEWQDSAYTITADDGKPIGFFTYNINNSDNYGFLKFVILDQSLRGQGYGTKMLNLICQFAFNMTGVSSIMLNVFDVNKAARQCYLRAGFAEEHTEETIFHFYEESWKRCHMIRRKQTK